MAEDTKLDSRPVETNRMYGLHTTKNISLPLFVIFWDIYFNAKIIENSLDLPVFCCKCALYYCGSLNNNLDENMIVVVPISKIFATFHGISTHYSELSVSYNVQNLVNLRNCA